MMSDEEVGSWYKTRRYWKDDQIAELIEDFVEKIVDERIDYHHLEDDISVWSTKVYDRYLYITLQEFNIPEDDWPFEKE